MVQRGGGVLTAQVFLSRWTGVRFRPARKANMENKLFRSMHSFAMSISFFTRATRFPKSGVQQTSVATHELSCSFLTKIALVQAS